MNERPQDLNLAELLWVLRRALLPLLAAALALALGAYLLSAARSPMYQAVASLAALPTGSGNQLVNSALMTAPALPPSVVSRALRSPVVYGDALAQLRAAGNFPGLNDFTAGVLEEARSGDYRLVTLASDTDINFVGVYEVRVQAPDPALAQAAAQAFGSALLTWDRQRAQAGVRDARRNLEVQNSELRRRIALSPPVEARALEQARSGVLGQIQQVDLLAQTVSGTLTALAPPVLPSEPVSPRPLRDALIVALATLFFGMLFALLREQLRPRIRSAEDLRDFGLPVLGTLPPLPRRSKTGGVALLTRGPFRERMEFVRLNLLAAEGEAGGRTPPLIAVTSPGANVGKSTVTAGLAAVLGARGVRTLLFDADHFKRQQSRLWGVVGGEALEGGVRLWPGVSSGVDLAVGSVSSNVAGVVRELSERGRVYDFVVVDTPPASQVADTLALISTLDGMVLVVDPSTTRAQVEGLLREVRQVGAQVSGIVFNRDAQVARGQDYGYSSASEPLPAMALQGERRP